MMTQSGTLCLPMLFQAPGRKRSQAYIRPINVACWAPLADEDGVDLGAICVSAASALHPPPM